MNNTTIQNMIHVNITPVNTHMMCHPLSNITSNMTETNNFTTYNNHQLGMPRMMITHVAKITEEGSRW